MTASANGPSIPGMDALEGERFAATRANLRALLELVPVEGERVRKAVGVAIACHARQNDRPDGSPYLQHVTSVARRVAEWHPSPGAELVSAALLHDSIEDQADCLIAMVPDVSGREPRDRAGAAVAALLGERVADMVAALTNPPFERMIGDTFGFPPDSAAYEALLLTRYVEHFVELIMRDEDTALIKLADFSDNALRLDFVRRHRPGRYPWLVRKYGPCVAFLREALPAMPAEHPLRRAHDQLRGDIEAAWLRDFAPRM